MQNYKDLVLENEIGSMQIARPIQDGVSNIIKYPLDVVEKLGKYQFIYDYKVPSLLDSIYTANLLNTGIKKESGSNANGTYNFDGDGTGGLKNLSGLFPKNVNNPNPQVGSFSKGNIVNVIRFDTNNNAIIENPNYVQPDPNAPKSFWSGFNFGDLKGQKEFSIPKNYLQKVDDSAPITIQTGVNFGANPNSQPMNSKPIFIGSEPSSDVILEENATFSLVKPFTYVASYTKGRPLYELGGAGSLQYVQTPNYETIPAGTKVTGRLFRYINNKKVLMTISGVRNSTFAPNVIEQDLLAVKGYGNTGSINIPIEYLTRDVATNTNNNNGAIVPVKNNNKNLLMIVGAFLVGYVLFNKKTPSN